MRLSRHAIIVPVLACLGLSGCAGWRSDDAAKKKAAPSPVGAIPIGEASAEADSAARRKRGDAPAPAVVADASVPPLPEDVSLRTTDVELGAQALIVAQEEKDRGDLDDRSISDRHAAIYRVWRPQMLARQAFLKQLADQRKHEADRQVAEAGRIAKHDADLHATEARLKRQVEAERRKTVPILTREDNALLE